MLWVRKFAGLGDAFRPDSNIGESGCGRSLLHCQHHIDQDAVLDRRTRPMNHFLDAATQLLWIRSLSFRPWRRRLAPATWCQAEACHGGLRLGA